MMTATAIHECRMKSLESAGKTRDLAEPAAPTGMALSRGGLPR
jgi:hypothetical protein